MPGRDPTAALATLLAGPRRLDDAARAALEQTDIVAAAVDGHVVPLASRAIDAAAPGSRHAATLRAAAAAWALREEAERRAICAFLDAARGLPLVFFKGASTAYTLYDSPGARMREDWDVFAAPEAGADAAAALERAGFAIDRTSKPGRVRMRQRTYRRDVPGSQCIVDLHLRALNPPALADRIPFADFAARSVALPALHAAARGLRDDAALVFACLHRLAHHSGEPRLAWDYDVLLLARRASPAVRAGIRECAVEWSAGPFVAAEVRRVLARFDEPIPEGMGELLDDLGTSAPALAPYLRENRSRAREFALDWRELGWRDRLALVGETVLPDAAFLRASTGSKRPLPLLYAARIARGVRSWFRSP